MTTKFDKLGWVAAAAMAVGMLVTGFQANTAPKFATVDVEKVFEDSQMKLDDMDTLRAANKSRIDALQFLSQNRAMDPKDADRFFALVRKAKPTPAETAEMEKLKTAGQAATAKFRELQLRPTPTDAEKTAIADYSAKSQQIQVLLQRTNDEFTRELRLLEEEVQGKSVEKIRSVIRDVAVKQGYTVVFESRSAPYGANDITADAAKVVAKK